MALQSSAGQSSAVQSSAGSHSAGKGSFGSGSWLAAAGQQHGSQGSAGQSSAGKGAAGSQQQGSMAPPTVPQRIGPQAHGIKAPPGTPGAHGQVRPLATPGSVEAPGSKRPRGLAGTPSMDLTGSQAGYPQAPPLPEPQYHQYHTQPGSLGSPISSLAPSPVQQQGFQQQGFQAGFGQFTPGTPMPSHMLPQFTGVLPSPLVDGQNGSPGWAQDPSSPTGWPWVDPTLWMQAPSSQAVVPIQQFPQAGSGSYPQMFDMATPGSTGPPSWPAPPGPWHER